jgi:hypothetical protein
MITLSIQSHKNIDSSGTTGTLPHDCFAQHKSRQITFLKYPPHKTCEVFGNLAGLYMLNSCMPIGLQNQKGTGCLLIHHYA